MRMHLYVCETGGPTTIGTDGAAPQWITCAACVKSLECDKCDGAQLQGDAPAFEVATHLTYRCSAGHERLIALPAGAGIPESTHCPDCNGMALPVNAPAPVAL
ncbi:MAG: hypothetical protein U0441_11790 [Polyangiaceae bacterium]